MRQCTEVPRSRGHSAFLHLYQYFPTQATYQHVYLGEHSDEAMWDPIRASSVGLGAMQASAWCGVHLDGCRPGCVWLVDGWCLGWGDGQ